MYERYKPGPKENRTTTSEPERVAAEGLRKIEPVDAVDLNRLLHERVKELDCLYAISRIVERPGITLEEILNEIVNILPLTWQYPEVACARIALGDGEYSSYRFEPSAWHQSSDIMVAGEKVGSVDVFYLEERPAAEEGPFLVDERALLDAVAERLGRIVERIRIQEELRASEERYRDLFENAGDLIQCMTADGRYLYVNRAWRETMGYGEEEVAELHMRDIIHPDDMEHCTLVMNQVMEGRQVQGVNARFVTRDGRIIEVEGSASCHTEEGNPAYTRGIYRDVTERKSLEKALRESEERFRAIASTATDAIIMMDDRGKISFWNPSAEKIFGYSGEEALGADLHLILVPEEQRESFLKALPFFSKEGKGANIGKTLELTSKRKDGTAMPIEMSLSSLKIGDRWYAVGIARDITERKKIEEDLREANRELEAFAHTLAHDLRGPLATAFGYSRTLELQRSDKLDENGREWLEEINRSLMRMDDFIRSLLEYVRVDRPQETGRVETAAVLGEVLHDLEPSFQGKEVNVELEGDIPAVEVPLVRLQQVFANLLGNAVKYGGDEDGVHIEIGAVREGDTVEIHVRDGGPGIPEKMLQSIFDPFVRVPSRGKVPGLGIGLATVKRAVQGWGGRIWAESELGHGTIFFFTAPAAA